MEKRPLGTTGMAVSEIAFGGAEIGLPYGMGVTSEADMLSEKEAIELLHASIDAGINFFDTARLYGTSEAIMGKAFHDRRDQVLIATKCGHFRDSDGSLPPAATLRKRIETSLRESLTDLQTDYVDVYMLHSANLEILQNQEVARIFSDLKASGAIRSTGASLYSVEEAQAALDSGVYEVIQSAFNLMDQRQETVFSDAIQRGVGLVIRSVLMRGLLTEKGKNLHPALQPVENHIAKYQELLGEAAPDLATLATRFALSFPAVSSILVGMDRLTYLHQSLEAANGRYLDEKTVVRAKELAYPDPTFINFPHWDKMGWL
ncbi:aldo/keto reductase [Larkinella knui]|uniref:Aldo/keto reductase n=1 Tax=Larkinella knui TaxID=2025310 RepID=A0A3P1CPA0_9BACT|nr:aldo/keto reductase [Larkinella knui]RRB14886.1 aldo/keto reductase [Larkinella knui]